MTGRLITVAAVVVVLLVTATSAGARNNHSVSASQAASVVHAGYGASAVTSSKRSAVRKRAAARKRAAKRRAAKRRAAKRRAAHKTLLRRVRKDPSLVTSGAFVSKAAALGFELPMTLRFQRVLNDSPLELQGKDDLLQIDPGNGAVGVTPFVLGSELAGPQQTFLSGEVHMYAIFTDPRIADLPGTMRLRVSNVEMQAEGVDLATCASPAPGDPPFLETGPIDMGLDPTFDSLGVTNLFTGTYELTLNLNLAFNTFRDDGCDGGAVTTRRAVTPVAGQRPVSIRMVGESQVSPAITRDGFTRMLLSQVDNSVEAQPPFSQLVNTCITAPAPPAEYCDAAEDEQILTRFKALNVSVEALIGH